MYNTHYEGPFKKKKRKKNIQNSQKTEKPSKWPRINRGKRILFLNNRRQLCPSVIMAAEFRSERGWSIVVPIANSEHRRD